MRESVRKTESDTVRESEQESETDRDVDHERMREWYYCCQLQLTIVNGIDML